MAALNEETLQAAMAPGIAKAREVCEGVAQELAGRSADKIHSELVSRLQAEPFEWDDECLQELAASISGESNESDDTTEVGQQNSDVDQKDFASEPLDPDDGTADAGAHPGHHEGGAGDASPNPAEGVTGGAPETVDNAQKVAETP